jgi:adenylate cyclase, class 2
MRQNYEIKAKIFNYDVAKWKAQSFIKKFKDKHHDVQYQKDIYYKVKDKRLKLRIINEEYGNLILYSKYDKYNKKISKYLIAEVTNPFELEEILRNFFKVLIVVNKRREIFIAENIRIHIDKVKGLGNFIEFEVIYNSFNSAKKIMQELIEYFELVEDGFIKNSYSDLLIKKQKYAVLSKKR